MTNADLSTQECVELLGTEEVARVALCGSGRPEIYPVNFAVHRSSIVFRTAVYSGFGNLLVQRPQVAVEVDHLEPESARGWSVVAHGTAEPIEDPDEIADLPRSARPTPWAVGSRNLYVRVTWDSLEGRRVGDWDDDPRDS